MTHVISKENKPKAVTLEGVRLMWRNFGGGPTRFNQAGGKREFAIALDPEVAQEMERLGWPIGYLEPRPDKEGDEGLWFIKVKISYNPIAKPPRIVQVTSRNKIELPEDMIKSLDYAYIINADVKISTSFYDVNGKTGYSVYLQTLYATIQEDDLDAKYADVPEASNSATSLLEPMEEEPEDEGVTFRPSY